MLDFLKRWGPAVLVMVVIFVASSQAKVDVPDFGLWDWPVKKAGHVLVYAALGAAYLRGLAEARVPTARQALLAVALAGLYGITDEYHQSFVPGRGATLLDVGIDTLGASLGVVLWLRWRRWQAREAPPRAHVG